MNRYARDFLMMRDGRNPYGSRGGYVVSGRGRGRDRMHEDMARGRGRMMGDYARNNRDRANDYNDYNYDMESNDYARNGRGRGNDYADYAGYENRDSGYGYGVGMFDYDTEDYGYDMARGRDGEHKLSSKELKKWEKELEGADGSKGKKWETDQIRQVAQQLNIHFDEYRPETLTAVANMLYSDFCKVLGADMMMYVKMAKAWLEDDDYEGDAEEKAMLYYKCIVSKDD